MVLKEEGGRFVNTYYGGSLRRGTMCLVILLTSKALQAVYPDYMPSSKPRRYWSDKENQKKFFDQLATKWNIQKNNDWNNVTVEMVMKEGGHFMKMYYGGSLRRGTNVSR
jgi:hypothetical protein